MNTVYIESHTNHTAETHSGLRRYDDIYIYVRKGAAAEG